MAKKNPSLSTDNVLVYDVASRVLQSRPLGVIYGEMNLYRDISNTENLNHVEEKLSRLESDAAIFVNSLHNSIANTGGSVTVTRKELGVFRKFLFIMHNRSRHFQFSYFNADLPENAPLKEWIKQRKLEKGFKDDKEVWVDALRHHLDRPHHKIIAEGEDILEKYGGTYYSKFKQGTIDPSTNILAVEYTTNANEYYMGIWEAANGSEFIIGSSSFGLWEGKYIPSTATELNGLHRLFPLSPHLVIVFRLAILRDFTSDITSEMFRGEISSDLFDIPIEIGVPRYPNYKGKVDDLEELRQYRRSDIAQKDTYTFKITQLSISQTQAVNNVFLLNAVQDGTVSFSSKRCMMDTLRAFANTDFIHLVKSLEIYTPLLMELATNISSSEGSKLQ